LRLVSEIAARDAQFIINDRFGAFGGDVRLDQGLYVTRKAEQSLVRILARRKETTAFILVVGEAGRGKTSLLWHLYRTLAGEGKWEPWFIKSTLFLGRARAAESPAMSAASKFDRESLLAAAVQGVRRGMRPVVLLDTADLLLRDEDGRDFLVELVLALQDCGASVIASCRPQEAVLLYPVGPFNVTLREYDEGELHEAINKHAARFYAVSVQKNYEEEFSHVLNAVARGLPIREVCSNPLTLRMLFTIYAPAAVPDDINVFKLYKEYWALRVERDLRAGSPLPSPRSVDLSEAAVAVAAAMLAEGTPELDARRLDRALAALGRSNEGVSEMIDRGVLHDSEAGTVTFFHQTFFEHSAARALLSWRGGNGLTVLRERRLSRPADLFIGPVYEQALLLSEQQLAPVVAEADRLLVELLRGESLALKLSGVYVYCHRQAVSEEMACVMREFLAAAEESPVLRFLELAPNTPDARLGALFSELDVVWARGNWREHEHLLKLLERLVPRRFTEVKKFVEQQGLLEYVLGKPREFTGVWKLLRMLTAIAEYDPPWSLRLLFELYIKAIPRAESRELQTAVLNTLCDHAALFGAHDIATRFEAATAQVDLDHSRDAEFLSDAYGRLLSTEWATRGCTVEEVAEEIKSTGAGLKLFARMRGLARVTSAGSERDAEVAFSYYRAEDGTPREWLWTKIVWPQVLSSGQPDSLGEGVADADASPASLYARREAARVLQDEGAGRGEVARLAQRIRSSIREAVLPSDSLRKMLDVPSLSLPEPWLAVEQYAPLLLDAFVAGHPGAAAAMERLLAESEKFWPAINHVAGPRLKRLSAAGGCALKMLLDLTLKTRDEGRLLRALEQATVPADEAYRRRVKELLSFQRRLLQSPSTKKRSRAVRLWSQLIRLGLAPVPTADELLRLIEGEADLRVRGQLALLIGQASGGARGYTAEVVNALEPLAKAGETDIREKSLAGMLKIVGDSSDDIRPYAMRMLDAALAPPTNAARVSLMRPLIRRLIDEDVGLAAEVFERLLTESRNAGLRINGSRTILGRFKPTARLLVRTASPEVSRRLLSRIPSLDRVLGVLVVDAVCHEALNTLAPELDELLTRDIHSDVKQVVIGYKYIHERSAGWTDLYDLLRTESSRRTET
jgi:hypothetical protein